MNLSKGGYSTTTNRWVVVSDSRWFH